MRRLSTQADDDDDEGNDRIIVDGDDDDDNEHNIEMRDFDKLRKRPLRDYYDDNATGGISRVGSTKTTATRGGGGEEEDDDDSIIDVAVVDVENDVEREIAKEGAIAAVVVVVVVVVYFVFDRRRRRERQRRRVADDPEDTAIHPPGDRDMAVLAGAVHDRHRRPQRARSR